MENETETETPVAVSVRERVQLTLVYFNGRAYGVHRLLPAAKSIGAVGLID